MSTIPAFINAIFSLNKKGEFPLYEGNIEGGYTKVSIISKVASGYSTRYYKVKQIIAFEGQQAIVQSFDLPSQEFAYRLIEKAITENLYLQGEDNEKIEVVATGQQSHESNSVDSTRVGENQSNSTYINNSSAAYQSVVTAQSRKFVEGYPAREQTTYPDYNDSSFESLQSFTGTGSDEFSGSEIKIANMSSFGNGSSSNRNRTKSASYESLEDALDRGF